MLEFLFFCRLTREELLLELFIVNVAALFIFMYPGPFLIGRLSDRLVISAATGDYSYEGLPLLFFCLAKKSYFALEFWTSTFFSSWYWA